MSHDHHHRGRHGHHRDHHEYADRDRHGEGHRHHHHEEHGPRRDDPDCCGPRDHHGGGRDCGCRDNDNPFHFQRRFITDDEVMKTLEDYLEDLENEAQGVREAIAELKAVMAEEAMESVEAPKPKKAKKKKKK
ncbi:MAG: hypothetical protein ISR64_06355 [Deltaproteobacteria bacterium]|nr:hypothetical protein [Deltaproteobacteria bacterium]